MCQRDGAIHINGKTRLGTASRGLPISPSPALIASIDAFRVCVCAGTKPKLFLAPAMLYSVQILALILPLNFCLTPHHHIIDLQGPWKFESLDGSFQGIGRVPGDIYSDLHRAGIIADPLFGDNHLQLKWVGNKDWSYLRNISVSSEVLSFAQIRLVVDGIDTISTITLNGEVVLSTENQFVKYSADVKGLIKEENVIEIELKSPIIYAQNKSDAYYKSKKHFIPPVCPPDIYHGECHPNFIRKAQYSFGWDWGPSIPTVGVWKPIKVVGFNEYYIEDVTWTTERGLGNEKD
uniref:beta-mannosidase n=1 Tax=Heterorhabditis bacteriophora TaxID=37862 RepID=A0A1I7XKL6_HETBA